MLTLSGTHDFTPFGEFMISPIHYLYIIYYWICQFYDYVYGLMTGLFAWISLTALPRGSFCLYMMTKLYSAMIDWSSGESSSHSKTIIQLNRWHIWLLIYIYRQYTCTCPALCLLLCWQLAHALHIWPDEVCHYLLSAVDVVTPGILGIARMDSTGRHPDVSS